jgi:hypothetical protein
LVANTIKFGCQYEEENKVIRNDSWLQVKHGLDRLRVRVREALAGAQPERWRQTPETTGDDDSARIDRDAPVAPAPDQIIPLVVYNQPWHQAGPSAECEDLAAGLSSQVKQSPGLREPQKEDQSEVLLRLMEDSGQGGVGDRNEGGCYWA